MIEQSKHNLLSDFATDDELAAAFNKSKRTIERWRRQGLLPPKTFGGLTSVRAVQQKLEAVV